LKSELAEWALSHDTPLFGFLLNSSLAGNAQLTARTERALRALAREVYVTNDAAASTIQAKLPEQERQTLMRALRTRPPVSDPLTVVDYLYLGQLPALLFATEVWQHIKFQVER
jgi:hypothetical protein